MGKHKITGSLLWSPSFDSASFSILADFVLLRAHQPRASFLSSSYSPSFAPPHMLLTSPSGHKHSSLSFPTSVISSPGSRCSYAPWEAAEPLTQAELISLSRAVLPFRHMRAEATRSDVHRWLSTLAFTRTINTHSPTQTFFSNSLFAIRRFCSHSAGSLSWPTVLLCVWVCVCLCVSCEHRALGCWELLLVD